jgi:hypothetical protein
MAVIGSSELTASGATTDEPDYSSITALDNGGWVVTWNYTAANSATILGVRSQVFNADGTTNGSQVQVATGSISELETIATADGGWLVASTRYADWRAWLQAYHADGSLDGGSFFANDNPGSYQIDLSAAPLEDGGYIMSWSENRHGWYQIYQQRFDAQGASVGGEISVTQDDNLASMSRLGQVAALEDGGWVTTWSTGEYYPYLRGVIAAKIYNADGSLRHETFLVDPDSMATQAVEGVPYITQDDPKVVGLSNGGFVVTYTIGAAENAIVWQEYFKIFNADGTAVTSYLPLNDIYDAGMTIHQQISPAIEALDNGRFIAVWQAEAKDGWGWGIYSQLFNADGSRNGDATLVNTTTDDDQSAPSVTVLKDGRWVIAWTDANGTDRISQKVFSYVTDAPEGSDKTFDISDSGHHSFTAADFGFSDSNNDAMTGVFITGLPGQGSLTLDGKAISEGEFVTTADLAKLRWTPPQNEIGDALATLTFKVKDAGDITDGGANLDHSANTLTFNVYHLNLAPSGTDQTVTMLEDTDRVLTKEDFGFVDDPGEKSADHFTGIIITAVRGHGSLELSDQSFQWNYNEAIGIDDISKIFIRPNADHNGNGLLQLDFKVVDDGGTAHGGHDTSATTNTLTIDVTAVNDAPNSDDQTVTIKEDKSYRFKADDFDFYDDNDADDNLAAVVISHLPTSGTLKLGSVAVRAGDVIAVAEIGNLVWTPDKDAHGDNLAEFTYKVVDDGGTANGGENTASTGSIFTFDVDAVNDKPTAVADKASLTEGKKVAVDVLANDRDIDGDTLSVSAAHVTSGNGTVMINKDGKLVVNYTGQDLDPGEKASVKVTYTAFDGDLSSNSTLSVAVTGVTEPGDKIYGTAKNNTINGSNVNEYIYGLAGNDTINGNGGNDTLIGGKGADTFIFGRNGDKDTISDFAATGKAHDIIDLSRLTSVEDFKDLKDDHMSQHQKDVWIDGGSGDVLTLKNIDIHDLGKIDFLF